MRLILLLVFPLTMATAASADFSTPRIHNLWFPEESQATPVPDEPAQPSN